MNILTDILPPQVRKYVYAAFVIAGLALAAWRASDGDWLTFAGLLLGSLGFGTAASNTPANSPSQPESGRAYVAHAVSLGVLALIVVVAVAPYLYTKDAGSAQAILGKASVVPAILGKA